MATEVNPRHASLGPSSYADRRAADRFVPPRPLSCQVTAVVREGQWAAQVRDLSTEGIGLVISQPFASGVVLGIDLANPSGRFVRFLLVRVLHCKKEAEGSFLLGGEFVGRLTQEELDFVLADNAPAVSGIGRQPPPTGG